MKRPFMVWIGFISICCSKVAKEGKSCPRLLVLQRVAQNAKSCSKVAEHNLFMPIRVDWSRMVYSPAGSSDLYLILGCIISNFLYELLISTLYFGSSWRSDTIVFARLNNPLPRLNREISWTSSYRYKNICFSEALEARALQKTIIHKTTGGRLRPSRVYARNAKWVLWKLAREPHAPNETGS